MNERDQLATNLRRLRCERKLTIGELAEMAHMHPGTIAGYEAGERMPSRAFLLALADAMQVEPWEIDPREARVAGME